MSSSFNAGGMGRKPALLLAAALTVALAISLGNVAESSAGGAHAVAAKKKCKKGKKSAVAAKKCKKKGPVQIGSPVPGPPAPLALTEGEVTNRVLQKAEQYCGEDAFCFDYGYYDDGTGQIECASKSTYTWVCYGWNDEDYPPFGSYDETCDFLEVVERDGYNGIKSHQDLSFGDNGWDCYVI
jgi:hypothetical protein